MTIEIALEVASVKSDGRREEWRHLAANSWVEQMAEFLRFNMAVENATMKETDGSETQPGVAMNLDIKSIATNDDDGIVLGSGSTAADAADFVLETKIVEGTGSGQLSYQACTVGSVTAVSGGYEFVITRQVNNDSGGTISVREASLQGTPASGKSYMWARDVFSVETIPDGEGRIYRYTITLLV